MRSIFSLIIGVLLCGCGQLPNPNDLQTIDPEDQAEVAYAQLKQATDALGVKVAQGTLTDTERFQKISEFSEELVKKVSADAVPPTSQWMYADLLSSSGRWGAAEDSLRIAVKSADSPDRRVNDSLKLARALAKNEKYEEAIKVAASTFDAKNEDTAPILLGILYEVAPLVKGHKLDAQLAELLEGAIKCHERTTVDLGTDEGKLFQAASRYHVKKAQDLIAQLRISG